MDSMDKNSPNQAKKRPSDGLVAKKSSLIIPSELSEMSIILEEILELR